MLGSKVLVVDGDRAARDALVTVLKFVGLEAHGAENACAAQSWLSTDAADVMVLADEIAEGVTTDSRTSIILLTRDSRPSRVQFRIDDTLRRPVALSHVVERVESLIEKRNSPRDDVLNFGALSLDKASGRVSSGSAQVVLGHFEVRLLAFFIASPDKVFSRDQLMRKLWPANVRIEERTVDVHVGRLRQGLVHIDCARYLQTVRCAGYRFSAF